MRFSISLFTSDRGIRPAAAARAAEEAGLYAFYVPEHTHIPVSRDTNHPATGDETLPDDRYMRTLDPWVALATAAEATSAIRLGTSVALPAQHHPITLAKSIATLDYLSNGRVTLGAGFGWNLEELADHGVDPKRRRAVVREYLGAMRELWSEDEAAFSGEFVSFSASWAWPKPVQAHIPTLIGAFGNARLFSWIVESADGWITTPIEENAENFRLLQQMWEDGGREGSPYIVVLDERTDEASLARWQELGVDEILFGLPDGPESEARAFLEERAALISKFA